MTPPAPRRAGDEAAERIISLLWLLLSAPHGLERDRIRRQVVGYEGLTDAAFEKLFPVSYTHLTLPTKRRV